MMMKTPPRYAALTLLCSVLGCASAQAPLDDKTPPTYSRYALDGLTLPERVADDADDLDGDGKPDNRLGNVIGALVANSFAGTSLIPKLLMQQSFIPSLSIPVPDLAPTATYPSTSVTWEGAPGDAHAELPGHEAAGRYISDRARTATTPVTITMRLPLFADCDPLVVAIVGAEMELSPDASGYAGVMHGALRADDALRQAAWKAVLQMLKNNPAGHVTLRSQLDTNKDGAVSFDEFLANVTVQGLLAPDIALFPTGAWGPDPSAMTKDSISLGFAFHLRKAQ